VNALSHYTDWTIAHVHSGALGWNGFMTFGMLYYLAPRIFQAKLWSKKLAELHFWVGTIGILLYIVAIYAAGVTQGLMWRAFDSTGRLAYPDFVETVVRILPMYWVRALGGLLFMSGVVLAFVNLLMTWKSRPKVYGPASDEAPALGKYEGPTTEFALPAHSTISDTGHRVIYFVQAKWHRVWERKPLKFTLWVAAAVIAASLFEIVPTFLIRSNVPTIAAVTPYTPLELAGRDIYVSEGCYNCHSQMVRPIRSETERYGEYSKPGEFVYDHPFQWGSRRIGPDLHRVGGKYPYLWHVRTCRTRARPRRNRSCPLTPGSSIATSTTQAFKSGSTRWRCSACPTAKRYFTPRTWRARKRSKSAQTSSRRAARLGSSNARSSRSSPTCSGSAPTSRNCRLRLRRAETKRRAPLRARASPRIFKLPKPTRKASSP
jgi:cytochrome c oxidase cbb3-type subunit I/II